MIRQLVEGYCIAQLAGAAIMLALSLLTGCGEPDLSYPCDTDQECETLEANAQAAGCYGTDSLEFEQACVNRVAEHSMKQDR